jgi:E3 ubiquitin-protein ligase RNF14
MSLEPSFSAPAREVGGRYWAAREEAVARLQAMAAAARVDHELSEDQFQGSNQIQEDEVTVVASLADCHVSCSVSSSITFRQGNSI